MPTIENYQQLFPHLTSVQKASLLFLKAADCMKLRTVTKNCLKVVEVTVYHDDYMIQNYCRLIYFVNQVSHIDPRWAVSRPPQASCAVAVASPTPHSAVDHRD